MEGMKKKLSVKTARDPNSRINKSLESGIANDYDHNKVSNLLKKY